MVREAVRVEPLADRRVAGLAFLVLVKDPFQRSGGLSSRNKSNKQLCPGTHRPAIRGINSRSRAHFPRQHRILHRLQKTAPEAEFVGVLPPFLVAPQHPIGPQKSIVQGIQPHFAPASRPLKTKRLDSRNTAPGHNKQQCQQTQQSNTNTIDRRDF